MIREALHKAEKEVMTEITKDLSSIGTKCFQTRGYPIEDAFQGAQEMVTEYQDVIRERIAKRAWEIGALTQD